MVITLGTLASSNGWVTLISPSQSAPVHLPGKWADDMSLGSISPVMCKRLGNVTTRRDGDGSHHKPFPDFRSIRELDQYLVGIAAHEDSSDWVCINLEHQGGAGNVFGQFFIAMRLDRHLLYPVVLLSNPLAWRTRRQRHPKPNKPVYLTPHFSYMQKQAVKEPASSGTRHTTSVSGYGRVPKPP